MAQVRKVIAVMDVETARKYEKIMYHQAGAEQAFMMAMQGFSNALQRTFAEQRAETTEKLALFWREQRARFNFEANASVNFDTESCELFTMVEETPPEAAAAGLSLAASNGVNLSGTTDSVTPAAPVAEEQAPTGAAAPAAANDNSGTPPAAGATDPQAAS